MKRFKDEYVLGSEHDGPFPHFGGCQSCQDEGRCNGCGAMIRSKMHCTNGRCMDCHDYCTSGGTVSPGHGFGKLGLRRIPKGDDA